MNLNYGKSSHNFLYSSSPKKAVHWARSKFCVRREQAADSRSACVIQQATLKNPFEYASVVSRIIKNKLADQLVEGIQYEKINEYYEMTQFVDIPNWQDNLILSPHSIYDHVIYDSNVEKEFVEGLESREDVKLYIKLPAWFTVPTPIGEYNPDWAIVLEKKNEDDEVEEVLYLVRETKDTRVLDELRPDEKRKIISGKKHFKNALFVDYDVIVSAKDL